jgi:hypothetical protein
MMQTTHALVGAALGRIARNRPLSFLLGVASHAVGDVLPHRECALSADVPLATLTVGLLAKRFGWDSPEMLGAVGGMAPDAEHVPTALGWQSDTDERFPTHGPYPQPWLHSMGRCPKDNVVQIGLAVAALLILSAQDKE